MPDPIVEPAPVPAPAPAPAPEPAPAPAPEPKPEPITSLLTDPLKDEPPKPGEAPPVPGKPLEEFKLKLPENALLDAASVEKIASFAKERGLSQEQAQALLERDDANAKAMEQFQQEQLKQQSQQWVKEVLADKEIGGVDAKKNVALAHRVIERFATPVLIEQLRSTGLGNHPELLRVFVNIGKLMTDDQLVLGSGNPKIEKSTAEIFYPDMYKPKES